MQNSKCYVKGINQKGEVFRPSNWAERLSSVGAYFGTDHRLRFSPLLQPQIRNGVICVVMDPMLEEVKPELYNYVMSFAAENDLITHLDEVA